MTGVILLVDDGQRRGGLAAARALGRAGWTVVVGTSAPGGPGLTAMSRYVAATHPLPRLGEGIDQFLSAVAATADAVGADLIFPTDDPEILALSWGRDRLDPARIPYPAHEAVVALHDKVALSRSAADAGVATPTTIDLADDDDARTAADRLPGPWVIKTRLSWDPQRTPVPRRWQTVVARTLDEAVAAVEQIRAEGGRPFLQAHTPGDLLALSVVTDRDGRPVAAVQGSGPPITWPPGAGPRVRSRTAPVDRQLLGRCATMLAAVGWWGLADIDFLVPADGRPRLIDVNGRFFGSMGIAAAAGIDLPDAWARVASGRPLPSGCRAGRPGVRWQWLEADLRRAFVERRGGLAVDLATTLLTAPRASHAVFDAGDPWPWLRHTASLGGRAANVIRRRGRGRPATTRPRRGRS